MMRLVLIFLAMWVAGMSLNAKTLVVYYSYTNNVEDIVNKLRSQIDCDVVEIEPAEKGLDYAANNYAIGSALISAIRNNPDDASSYPEIDPVEANLDEYDTVIIGAPLWWSQMAAPLQTYLFDNGKKMAGKKIGLIVSSHSSGISGVVADAKRLIPNGEFLEPALWIRSSQTANCQSLISQWLEDIDYKGITATVGGITSDLSATVTVYNLNGVMVTEKSISDLSQMPRGVYIVKNSDSVARKMIIK